MTKRLPLLPSLALLVLGAVAAHHYVMNVFGPAEIRCTLGNSEMSFYADRIWKTGDIYRIRDVDGYNVELPVSACLVIHNIDGAKHPQ